jgi:hypothetical protein
MTKIKTFSATVLLFAAVAASVFAQDRGVLGSRYGREPSRLRQQRNERARGFRSDRRPVQSQQSLESHRPSRSRHKQQPSWERRR